MEEMEDMTVLSLGIGSRSEHSKSSRTGVCKLKLPVRFHELFPAQLLEGTDHKLVTVRKESKAAKRTCYNSHEDHEDSEKSNGHTRKKLRLNEEQLMVLETVYEEHSNLHPAIKQGLAEQLNIKPRQVEVWFQNRRARSKQKQTEADCENLKRWCEGLNKENQILKKELQELMRVPHPGLLLPDKTHNGPNLVAMCSSCNKMIIREPPNLMKL